MPDWIEKNWDLFENYWPLMLTVFVFVFELACALHAILYKRDTRATITWMGLIWLTPFVGAVLYILFGVNRIQRRARRLRGRLVYSKSAAKHSAVPKNQLPDKIGNQFHYFEPLVRMIDQLAEQPLLAGNKIDPLINGDEAYPAMIEAIENAKVSVTLCTYIFDNDQAGKRFVDALTAAKERGVEIRILIDDVGSRYSFPSVVWKLRYRGIRVARFMPNFFPTRFAYSNLRLHRKVMVVDGRFGFTGGMNIREGGWHSLNCKSKMCDTHFRCTGPIVAQLQESFAEDWVFSTKELLEGEKWFPLIEPDGPILARGVPSGPDEDFGELRTAVVGALGAAKKKIAIVTPYFLPDDAIIEALNVAALRGVQVDIILPNMNNLRLVHWACRATLPQVLERGCRVWFQSGCFDHTKLLVIDGIWSMFGSANWDPRSFRLNFEYNVESYDADLAAKLQKLVDERLSHATEMTRDILAARPWLIKVRDGVARLFSPML